MDDKEKYVLNDRFRKVYEALRQKYKVKEIVKKLDFSGSRQLYNVLEDKNLITSHAIFALSNNFNVSPNYIFLGVGSMLIDPDDPVPETKINQYEEDKAVSDELIMTLIKKNDELEEQLKLKEKFFNEVINTYKEKLSKYEGDSTKATEQEQSKEIDLEKIKKKYLNK